MKNKIDMQRVFDCSGDDYAENMFKGFSGVKREEWKLFYRYTNKNNKILDLCCGPGTNLIPLVKQGYDVEGIDFSQKLIDYAKKMAKKEHLRIKISLGDATDVKRDDNTYDIVLVLGDSIGLIPGVQRRQKVFNECYRILKKDGFLIASLSNRYGNLSRCTKTILIYIKNIILLRKRMLGECIFKLDGTPGFHHSYSKKELISSLKREGFKIREIAFSENKFIFAAQK